MVKSKSKRSRKVVRPKASRKRAPRQRMLALDAQAAAYARLLADPCNAPIVHPIYPGGDAGYLFRAESFGTFGQGAGITSGVVHWTPGYVNASDTQLLTMAAATSGTGVTLAVAAPNTLTPGKAFLTANARGCRCVAACLKVTYSGAESNRSGRVHYGLTTAGLADLGQGVTADEVAQTLQHFTRTPAESFEIIWKPSVGDTEFNDPSEAASAVIRDRKSAITVAFAGLPANVGLTFHFTAVYEWTPAAGQGIGHNALGKARSRNSLDDVIDVLVQGGFTFVRHAGGMAGAVLGNAITSGISRTFGIIPARQMTRSIGFS